MPLCPNHCLIAVPGGEGTTHDKTQIKVLDTEDLNKWVITAVIISYTISDISFHVV